jgi:hypothetical protein
MNPISLSPSTLTPVDLDGLVSRQQLEGRLQEVQDVLALHQVDPVAGLEVWKAMGNRTSFNQTFSSGASVAVNRRRNELALHQSSVQASFCSADERKQRLRRSGAYPQRVLLAMDPSVAQCSAVELQTRAEAVAAETRRFTTELRRWRGTVDKGDASAVPNLAETQALHALETELLEAKLLDLSEQADAMEERVRRQEVKLALMQKHTYRILGPLADDSVPPIISADDMQAELKATLSEIRSVKSQREAQCQQHARLLVRADRKVRGLEAELDAMQRRAVAEANGDDTSEADRLDAMVARHELRQTAIVAAAIDGIVAAEQARRAELEKAQSAASKIIRADIQVAQLQQQAAAAGRPVANGPAFVVPKAVGNSTAMYGRRSKQQQPRR